MATAAQIVSAQPFDANLRPEALRFSLSRQLLFTRMATVAPRTPARQRDRVVAGVV
jgi:hypothetical protein